MENMVTRNEPQAKPDQKPPRRPSQAILDLEPPKEDAVKKRHINGSIKAYIRSQIMADPDNPLLAKAWAELIGEP